MTTTTWTRRGACRTADPELFFPISHTGPRGQADTEEAKKVCRACTVLRNCRADVLDNPPEYGVFAATTPDERRTLRARRLNPN
ncbi:WhiB family transcriptional regulator [Streptosporangium oxazolinicum]|uniref:Transcriptional regulator WhiB n=1 Tax=Streptosporangium oxazolinicum TaxID=909287 RepID=A0ABP8BL20_9ACTN